MPFSFVFSTRVSFVWSPTTVTTVPGKTPPLLSATEPVMPPSVCCASARGKTAKGEHSSDAKRAASLILLSIHDLEQIGIHPCRTAAWRSNQCSIVQDVRGRYGLLCACT